MHVVTTVPRRREAHPTGRSVAGQAPRRTPHLVLAATLVAAGLAIAVTTTTSSTDLPEHGPPTWQEIAADG